MIDAITLETAHHLGDALASMHRLRHRVFVERQKYTVPTYRNMEWDQFDTPAAVYLVWRDDDGEARAVTRLIPTTFPYMIQELWPDLVQGEALPSNDTTWEATRFGIDRGLDPDTRRRVLGELVCGCLEYGLRNGIDQFLCVMPIQIINGAIRAAGVTVDVLGEPRKLGGLPVVSGRVHITRGALLGARRHYGIKQPVLNIAGEVRAPKPIVQPARPQTETDSDRRIPSTINAGPSSPIEPCRYHCFGNPASDALVTDEPQEGWPIPFPPPPYAFAAIASTYKARAAL